MDSDKFWLWTRPGGTPETQFQLRVTLYLSLQLFDPVLGPRKGVGVGDVVDHDGSLSTTVVHWRKRVVSFLWQQGMWKMIRKIEHWSTIRQ